MSAEATTAPADTPPANTTTAESAPAGEAAAAPLQVDGSGDDDASKATALNEPSYAVDVKLADLQADPNNPLFSAKSFEELNL